MLEVKNFSVLIDNRYPIKGINFHLKQGGLLAITGPNGSGKTTLLRGLLGLLPTSGQVIYQSKIITKLPPNVIGYVPQRFLFPGILPLTVKEFLNLSRNTQIDLKLCSQLEIDRLMDQVLSTLSGGQLQRVVLARALLRKPQLLVLDEASASIDISGKQQLVTLLIHLLKKHSVGIITVTHDEEELKYYKDNLGKNFYALKLS